ncbi:MAG: nucleotide pyrophosphohydrolase [Promethearchaeota archaeon]
MNEKNECKDQDTTISFFKAEVKKFVEERNWSKYHTPKNIVQAIHCEAGELSQLLLFKDYSKIQIWDNQHLMTRISDEIADVFIYLLSLVNALKIDLSTAFIKKMEKNREKYKIEEFYNGKYYKK